MVLITCQNASFAYDNKTVLEDVSFELNEGAYLCVVGENGSGKSTLVKGLLRLTRLSGGRAEIALKQSQIGYMPQQTPSQKDFPASVYEVVLSGRLGARGINPFYSKRDKEAAIYNMERLGIRSFRNECYRELSGGQQQRVLLARALCGARRLLILDEPLAGLDPLAAKEFYSYIREINSDGMTVIMVSHDIHGAVKHAEYILHLQNRQEFFGKTQDYLDSPKGTAFIGSAPDTDCEGGREE